MESVLNYVFAIIGIYLLLGFVFYLVFIFKLATQLDENMRGSGVGFKLLILPGTLVLWPVLFSKWKKRLKK
ncbi:hypothetical protein QQ020_24580 [Fulvivirgaceae bacterium BMA12]|uniref:Uncharacterized protein n=1 Tax=Agaribacillus aureus TaxID=3051825 RepID=A0ABT8LBW8_9BACT|nr:hypothetical protein [Fulvivirgaceae bacterium BMA12]